MATSILLRAGMNETRDPGADDNSRSPLSPEQHNIEVVKLYFEFFKHFTTISTAAALVELALYQQLQLDSTVAVIGVMAAGTTLFLSIIGMASLPIYSSREKEFPAVGRIYELLIVGIAYVFMLGVFLYVQAAAFPGLLEGVWQNLLVLASALVGVVWSAIRILRRSGAAGERNSEGSSNGDDDVQSERRDT